MGNYNLNNIHFINGNEAFKQLSRYLDANKQAKVLVLVDENTQHYCLPILQKMLNSNLISIQIPSGEINKNLDTCRRLWQDLINLKVDRSSILINLGGGVITDLGGFVAATFKRGIRFINIPTSLLGMVDASIGGKTGVDFQQLKNQIGIFAKPEMTLIYASFLNTLAPREIRSGLAEVIKYALIDDASIWNFIQTMDPTSSDVDPSIIQKSVHIKERIVTQDPTEKGIRKTLNFGHTLGHAIETHYLSKDRNSRLLHGEAVATGMLLAAHLSYQTQNFPFKKMIEIASVINSLYPKINISEHDIAPILNLLKHDKKSSNGQANFVLLQAIGKPVLDCQVNEEQIKQAFEFYLTHP